MLSPHFTLADWCSRLQLIGYSDPEGKKICYSIYLNNDISNIVVVGIEISVHISEGFFLF